MMDEQMKIYDEEWNEIDESNIDLDSGYVFVTKRLVAHHPAVEAKAAVYHKDYIEFLNVGGVEIVKVIDEEEVEAKEAYDEYEECMQYARYTDEQKADVEIQKLKTFLSETDYVVLKIAEGVSSIEDYESVIDKRKEARVRIGELRDRYKL